MYYRILKDFNYHIVLYLQHFLSNHTFDNNDGQAEAFKVTSKKLSSILHVFDLFNLLSINLICILFNFCFLLSLFALIFYNRTTFAHQKSLQNLFKLYKGFLSSPLLVQNYCLNNIHSDIRIHKHWVKVCLLYYYNHWKN